MKPKGAGAVPLPTPDRNRLAIRVVPNARKTEIVGCADGVVRVRLQAPAVEGRANEELVRFLAEVFDLRRSQVAIVRGAKSREKWLELTGWESKSAAAESAAVFAMRWAAKADPAAGIIR